MEAITAFGLAFVFSFIGTIPPGTLNLMIIQMGLEHQERIAWKFAVAACFVEYFYAWAAVAFEELITASTSITENFQLVTAIVMLLLGFSGLWLSGRPSQVVQRFSESGFRKGLLLGVLNPMALPFWLAMTAYIKSQRWTDLSDGWELHAYLLGVSVGGLALLMVFFYLARKVVSYFNSKTIIKRIPSITLLILGLYALINYLL